MTTSDTKKFLKFTVLAIFFIFIIVYSFFRSRDLIFGVKIRNVNINNVPTESGVKIVESVKTIMGNAKNAVNITLNGREISIDKEGNFKETVALLSGYNTLNIQAKDKFGKSNEKNYQLIYSPIEQPIEELKENI